MITQELLSSLPLEEQIVCACGAKSYIEDTKGGTASISLERARQYPDVVIQAILRYTMLDDELDFEYDTVALETVETLVSVLMERNPERKTDVKAKWEEFKRDYLGEDLDNG